VFTKLLVPKYVERDVPFARNRMVLIHSNTSRFASEITQENWYRVLTRPGVEVGHSDPNLDHAGYRTLLVYQLAEQFYKQPGLAHALARSAPLRNVRPKSADLIALVQTGNLDYAWGYESVALDAGLPYVILPPQINLGDSADSTFYATAATHVAGATPRDTVVMRGEPIVYGIASPRHPPHGDIGARFITFLMSPTGQTILRRQHLTPFL
jgi:molybdate/tungstate transport system substrate-binding protein